MRIRHYHFLNFIPTALFCIGCIAIAPSALAEPYDNAVVVTETTPAQTTPGEFPTSPTAADHVSNMQKNSVIEQSIEDLARRKSILPSIIEVVSYEEVTWPDASLGCPLPDMHYIQVQQDGARVILRIDDVVYVYHSGGKRLPFLCTNPVHTKPQLPWSNLNV
jgi:hypothetical protein